MFKYSYPRCQTIRSCHFGSKYGTLKEYQQFQYIQPSIMAQLSSPLQAHLSALLPPATLAAWTRQLQQEQELQKQKINTPATNSTNTSWRKQGNAIDKIRRKRNLNPPERQGQVEGSQFDQTLTRDDMKNSLTVTTTKVLIKNKAVFFGEDCELPYLHSSDAISHMYTRKGQEQEAAPPVLYNPPPSVQRSQLTGLKSLHIYHTSIDSLRQLGTGWCSLKELSILYGRLNDLSGLSSFSSLEELFIAFNQISSLSDLMFHPTLRCLDLERNRVQSLEEVQYIATMDKLQYINLNSNPLMRKKETRRIVHEKLGKLLDNQDYQRLLDFQLSQMAQLFQLEGYQNIQASTALIRSCNEALAQDQITVEQIYQSYLESPSEKAQEVDFIRYESKPPATNLDESCLEEENPQEEELIFTPLFHFLPGKKHYTNTIKKYFQNKLYISLKKQESANPSQSPAHSFNSRPSSRLAKFTASTRLERKEDVESADNLQSLTSEIHSTEKAKRARLSLGKTKKLLQKFDKEVNPGSKLVSNLSTTTNSISKLKRGSLLGKKCGPGDLEVEIEKRFSKTGNIGSEL